MLATYSSGLGKCYLGFSPKVAKSVMLIILLSLRNVGREKLLFLLQHFLRNNTAKQEQGRQC